MTKHEDRVRIQHMLEAAKKRVRFIQGRTRADLDTDELLTLAIVRLLEIVGEASKNVSQDLKARYSEVPWRQISGTRDRLIHGYFDVDLDIIWEIVSADLPSLIPTFEQIVRDQDEDDI